MSQGTHRLRSFRLSRPRKSVQTEPVVLACAGETSPEANQNKLERLSQTPNGKTKNNGRTLTFIWWRVKDGKGSERR